MTKRFILCVILVAAGMMTSCEKYAEVDADNKPEWLGGSIYQELKNPEATGLLTGTFNTYLRLVDDLGYAETLDRTGSKTVFPANDEAFDRFFKNNTWGVSGYDELSETQKKHLLYSSMLDNAMLIGMLPNVSSGSTTVKKGSGIKHATSVSVIDSVTWVPDSSGMPKNNSYWTKYYQKGLNLVMDNTSPMMVHLTREYMINQGITTVGDESDFAILTGTPFEEGSAYVFSNRIINSDVTCLNGYIHQMEDVLTNPGNMAQMLRGKSDARLFSRMVDYFSAPYYDATTTAQYNDWAIANGKPLKDSIFQLRYLSLRSQESALRTDPNGTTMSNNRVLRFDPGWNGYFPGSQYSSGVDHSITDIGAMFVPTDKAVKEYFLPGGNGAFLIDIYGKQPNTEENLVENLDSLQNEDPHILASFINNLMMQSFAQTVPSKFQTINNDAAENMGMNLSLLSRNAEGKYDIQFANNGVIYMLKEMIAPDEYQAVLAPSSSYKDMRVMNWAVQDNSVLGVDFKYYLLAMSANYAYFIPDDAAFEQYYVDPTSLGRNQKEVLKFTHDGKNLLCQRYRYNMSTGEVGAAIGSPLSSAGLEPTISQVKTQLVDILNYHTVVLGDGETIDKYSYLKTKHGGAIYVGGGNRVGGTVQSGAQIDNGLPVSNITQVYHEKNGYAYRIDHVIQAPQNSVYKTLELDKDCSEFLNLCGIFDDSDLLNWVGISDSINEFKKTAQDPYLVFTANYGTVDQTLLSGTDEASRAAREAEKKKVNACVDYNVKFFNTYNYTLYAPTNAAMEEAYEAGLPREDDIRKVYDQYKDITTNTKEVNDAKSIIYTKLRALRDFVRYHFQSSSVYADKVIEGGRYQSMCTDELGRAEEVILSGGDGRLVVTDNAGVQHEVLATDSHSNKMARDYWFDNTRDEASAIVTSSFCVVHQIDHPLYLNKNQRYDNAWASREAKARSQATYQRLKAMKKL